MSRVFPIYTTLVKRVYSEKWAAINEACTMCMSVRIHVLTGTSQPMFLCKLYKRDPYTGLYILHRHIVWAACEKRDRKILILCYSKMIIGAMARQCLSYNHVYSYTQQAVKMKGKPSNKQTHSAPGKMNTSTPNHLHMTSLLKS